jgi:PAS domain S-box-containing protein
MKQTSVIPDHFLLLRDEDVFASILENLNLGVALINNEGFFVSYNKKFLNLFGLSEESTIKNVNDQNWADWQVFDENLNLLHVDEHPVRKAAITGRIVKNQLVGVRLPSGKKIVWMLISAEPLFNKKDEIEKTICTYLDVTEHKLADEALRRSEQKYRQLFNSMSEIFQVIELIYNEGKVVDYYYRDINPAFEQLTGRSRENLLNKKVSEIYPGINRQWFDVFDEVNRTGNPVKFESFGNIFKRYYELFVWKTVEDRLAVILTDISERKAAEKLLIESENKFRDLNLTKDKLFSIISHDLKSPFSSIIGFSELLVERLNTGDTKSAGDFARIILDSSWQAMDLLTNLIEWSRVQTGRISFNPEPLNIGSVINDVSGHLSASAKQKSIEITIETRGNLQIFADRSLLSTVLRNLISNSIKFTGQGGKIMISAAGEKDKLILTVEDNGMGMSRESIDHLFSLESGTSTPGTRNETGTGLGMIICREFVLRHDGEISVESEPGKGSRFIISLPRKKDHRNKLKQ